MENVKLMNLISLLNDDNKKAIETIVKNLVIASDPDYIKLTREEKKNLDNALKSKKTISLEELKNKLAIV